MSILLRPPHWFVGQITYNPNNLIHAKRLCEEMTSALPQQFARIMDVRVADHETNRDFDIVGSNTIENLSAIEAASFNVEEDNDNLPAVIATMIERFLAVLYRPHMKAMVLQISLQKLAIARFVIDNENAAAVVAVGPVFRRVRCNGP